MKKHIALIAMAMLFVPMTASAFEVVIPYFLDGGRLVGSTPEPDDVKGGAAFITMVNLTSDTLILGVVYTDPEGLDATPTDNTFELNPLSSTGYRPVRDDPGGELQSIPNALPVGRFQFVAAGHGGSGGLRMVLVGPYGSPDDVTLYPNYDDWGPAPFTLLLNQYVFYDWALAGSGMEGGFISKPLEK